MDKITDKIAALPPDATYFSLEFFPPKTAMGFANLRDRLDRMARALRPLFVNVTWGAGGSTAQKSLELAEICQRELGLTTCLHLTCTNMSRELIDRALDDAKALGIRNILALRGDPPRPTEYGDAADIAKDSAASGADLEFAHASDLVRYIRQQHGDYFCIGAAAYPEGHAEENHPLGQSLAHDLPYLVEKVQAGADFLMTQLFFDGAAYDAFETALATHPSGVFAGLPIIPGLMPVQNYQMIKRTTKLSHARVPDAVQARLEAVKKDDAQVKSVGVDILSELVEQIKVIKRRTQPGRPQGFHFYTLNLEKAVSFVVERTHLIREAVADDADSVVVPSIRVSEVLGRPLTKHNADRRPSIGSDPRNRVIVAGQRTSNADYEATALEAGVPAEPVNTRANTLAISEGEGVLGREATWDDFPNGRWGDARSPAYGEIDGYGTSLHMTVNQALKLWGRPTVAEDISHIFTRYLDGALPAIPWSEEQVNPETQTIKAQLVRLNSKGWWTVASQPAVNGTASSDATFGWGPPNGFVFQKAFVEFFVPAGDWAALRARLAAPDVRDQVCYFAINARGDFVSSDLGARQRARSEDEEGALEASTNAVTWGVFPGKEIITPTIIEEVSFRAWSEEAFDIWKEWAALYPKGSATDRLLEQTRADYWLVNIIHHDYVDKEALWRLLSA